MYSQDNDEQEIQYLEYRIKQAQENNEPIDSYVKREIEWLEKQLDKFLVQMKEQGRDIENDIDIAEMEIRQYATMRNLAQKIGLPAELYDTKIKQVQIRIFGEKNWENFFGNK